MRNFSFNYIVSLFNNAVHIYYLLVVGLTNDPILHVTYMHSGYSENKLMINGEMDNASKSFK